MKAAITMKGSASAQARGRQVLIAPKDLVELIHAEAADLTQK